MASLSVALCHLTVPLVSFNPLHSSPSRSFRLPVGRSLATPYGLRDRSPFGRRPSGRSEKGSE